MISVLYAATTIICIGSILNLTKTHTKLLWLPIAILLQVSFLALAFGLLAICGIGYSVPVAIIINVLASFIITLIARKSASEKEKTIGNSSGPDVNEVTKTRSPVASRTDIACYVTVATVAATCALVQFTPNLNISFLASDAAIHCDHIYQTYLGSVVSGQYFSYLFTVSLMSMWPVHIPQELSFYPFIYGEILSFGLSGLLFYMCTNAYCPKMKAPTRCAVIALYMLGYPLNSMLNGFSYLGMSITTISAIIFICKQMADSRSTPLLLCSLGFFLLDISAGYLLFLPPLFVCLIAFLIILAKKQSIPAPVTVSFLLVIFGVPAAICLMVVYTGFFPSAGTATVVSAIKAEGGTFKSFYSQFVFIAPLFIFEIVMRVKSRQIDFLEYLSGAFLGYTAIIFVLGMLQKVSAHYYFKLYFVLWLVFFIYTALAIQRLKKRTPVLLASYCSTWLVIIALLFTGVDAKIGESRPKFNQTPASYEMLPVYAENLERIGTERYDQDTLDLLRKGAELRDQEATVNMLVNDTLIRWDKTLYGGNDLIWWHFADDELVEQLNNYDYVLVGNHSPHLSTKDNHGIADIISNDAFCGEIIYSNEAGEIYKIRKD